MWAGSRGTEGGFQCHEGHGKHAALIVITHLLKRYFSVDLSQELPSIVEFIAS